MAAWQSALRGGVSRDATVGFYHGGGRGPGRAVIARGTAVGGGSVCMSAKVDTGPPAAGAWLFGGDG